MSFGHFAGGFAEAFSNTLFNKREQQRKDKMAKLQGQLVELQLKAAEQKQDAQTQVTDMMAGNTLGEFEMQPYAGMAQGQSMVADESGMQPVAPGTAQGLMPRQEPGVGESMSLTELLADPEGELAAMQAGYYQPQPPTDFEQIASAAGIEQGSPEFQELAKNFLDRGSESDPSAFLAQMMMAEKLAEQQRKNNEAERTRNEKVQGAKISVRNDYKHASEAINIMSELRDTALQAGVPFADFWSELQAGGAAIAGMAGFDVTKVQRAVALRQRLNKLMQDGIIEGLSRFEGTGGSVQNSKMELLIEASASLGVGEFPNIKVIADIIENNLDMAKIQNIPIEDEEAQRAAIDEWRQTAESLFDTQQAPIIDAPAVIEKYSTMTEEAIKKLDIAEVAKEGEAALQALAERMEELGMD